MVPVALIKHLDQKQLAGKDLFHLHFWIAAITEGSTGRNSNRVGPEGGTEAETVDGCCLLA